MGKERPRARLRGAGPARPPRRGRACGGTSGAGRSETAARMAARGGEQRTGRDGVGSAGAVTTRDEGCVNSVSERTAQTATAFGLLLHIGARPGPGPGPEVQVRSG